MRTITSERFPSAFAGVLLFLAAASRVLPHPPNFAPITAMAVFAGWVFPRYWLAVAAVTATMFISDVGLALLHDNWGYLIHGMLPIVYGTFAIMIALSRTIARQRRSYSGVLVALVSSSLLFFVVTNFFVWAFGTMYPHTLDGLATCYAMAIPFYHVNGLAPFELLRNAIAGDLVYTCVIWGAYFVVNRRWGSVVAGTVFLRNK